MRIAQRRKIMSRYFIPKFFCFFCKREIQDTFTKRYWSSKYAFECFRCAVIRQLERRFKIYCFKRANRRANNGKI